MGFFGHAKYRYMLKKHGASGPLGILAIWSQMMENDGIFDARKDFNIDKIADTIGVENAEILAIIQSGIHCNMLTTAEPDVYVKSKITETLKILENLSERGKKGGEASAEKRKGNNKSTTGAQQVNNGSTTAAQIRIDKIRTEQNIQTPLNRGSAIAITAAPAPLWAQFAEKYLIPADAKNFELYKSCLGEALRLPNAKADFKKTVAAKIKKHGIESLREDPVNAIQDIWREMQGMTIDFEFVNDHASHPIINSNSTDEPEEQP